MPEAILPAVLQVGARNGGVPKSACARIEHDVNYGVVELPGRAPTPPERLEDYCGRPGRRSPASAGKARAGAPVTDAFACPDPTPAVLSRPPEITAIRCPTARWPPRARSRCGL